MGGGGRPQRAAARVIINGITVNVWHRAGTTNAIADSAIQLMKNNIPAGTNNALR